MKLQQNKLFLLTIEIKALSNRFKSIFANWH